MHTENRCYRRRAPKPRYVSSRLDGFWNDTALRRGIFPLWRIHEICSSLGCIETTTRAAVALALGSLMFSGCTVYQTAPGVYAPASPNAFDGAWEATRGAAYDEGVTVTSEDRSRGVIMGRKDRRLM
jgi:hypothetical protein